MAMKALVKTRPGPGLELADVAVPDPGADEVLVKVAVAAVCGSDVARYRWSRNYAAGGAKDMTGDLPRILGHEFSGTVERCGPEAGAELAPGRRVAIRNVLACGRCRWCAAGYVNTCVNRRTIGVHTDGGYAEYAVVPAANCAPLPDSFDLRLAAALQPFAVATHAVRRSGVGPGETFAVWGLGPVGMAVVMAAKLRGGVPVGVFDPNQDRVEEARQLGLPAHDPSEADPADVLAPRSVDALFDAAGAAAQVIGRTGALVQRGPIVLIGNIPSLVEIDLMPVVMDEQRLLGSRSYSIAAWEQALHTIEATEYERTLGDDVPLSEALPRFELAARGGGRPFAIVP